MTTDLVMIKNNKVVVSSRQIAESFSKRHSDVLRAVTKLINLTQNCVKCFFYLTFVRQNIKIIMADKIKGV